MHLKQLVLKGFKSFADRSALNFEPGISAIVGPNGSGKSNISDAVLWVLGERNAKNLRGQAMEDVIFAGSSARKPVSVAEVDLVLDNSDGTLPVDYDEVSITRRMYRSGESEYLINGALARRMDVLDILHDSGLGTGTHSIISQGSLDSILQSRPEDRRALIEEAAGVLKHKQRKQKSARKIERMDQHVARVRDVAGEIERQLGPLERKAKRARAHAEASAELSQVDLALAVDDLRTLQGKWHEADETEARLTERAEAVRRTVEAAEAAAEALQQKAQEESLGAGELARRHRAVQGAAERFDALSMLVREKRRTAQREAERLEVALEENRAKAASARGELAHAEEQLSQVKAELQAAQAKFSRLSGRRDELARTARDLRVRLRPPATPNGSCAPRSRRRRSAAPSRRRRSPAAWRMRSSSAVMPRSWKSSSTALSTRPTPCGRTPPRRRRGLTSSRPPTSARARTWAMPSTPPRPPAPGWTRRARRAPMPTRRCARSRRWSARRSPRTRRSRGRSSTVRARRRALASSRTL